MKILAAGGVTFTLAGLGGFSLLNKNSNVKNASAQSAGTWSTGPNTLTIAIHAAMLRSGKILYLAGSGYHNSNQHGPFRACLLDPNSGSQEEFTMSEDLFCAGQATLPDGKILLAGGTLRYDVDADNCNGRWHGLQAAYEFDASSESFSKVSSMRHGRWYPTLITLPDGKVATFSGYDEYGVINRLVEVYQPSPQSWTLQLDPNTSTTYCAGSGYSGTCPGAGSPCYGGSGTGGVTANLGLYPRAHLMPSGLVVVCGMAVNIRTWNPSTGAWGTAGSSSTYRHYGASILLPLNNTASENGKILLVGGSPTSSSAATRTVEILDFNAGSPTSPSRRTVGSLAQARKFLLPIILPDGKVAVFGGSSQGNGSPVYVPEIFDPANETWSSLASASVPRVYHGVALLLPDGRVWTAGSTPGRGSWELRTEIFRPGYISSTRPTISGTPTVGDYGASITLETPDAADVQTVSLVALNNTTHHYDANARLVWLDVQSRTSNSVTVSAPINSRIAPPGYYTIHVLVSGIPSAGMILKIPGSGSGGGGGGGGGEPGEVFYDVAFPGNGAAALFSGSNVRYGEQARNASSIIVGKALKSWTVYMRRVGSASGTVSAVVRRSSDDSAVATFSETLDASTLSTSFAAQTFTLTDPYTIQSGDRIMVEYSGPSRIELSIWTSDQVDGGNTCRTRFAAGSYAISTATDIAGTMSSEGTSSPPPPAGQFVSIYSVTGESSYANLSTGGASFYTRAGEVMSASSQLIGESVKRVSVLLRGAGNPTGTINVVVRRGSDDSVALTFGTIDAASLTTSDQTFTLTAPSSHTFAANDKVLVEWGGTGNGADQVRVKRKSTTNDFDGANTYHLYYSTGYSTGTTRDLAGEWFKEQ